MTILQTRKLFDLKAMNRSTGILNGESSNVLNWNDIRFTWAYVKYKKMREFFWIPQTINLSTDVRQYQELSADERYAYDMIMGLLASLDSIQTDLVGRLSDYFTDSSINALMKTIAFFEIIHNESYSYVLSSVATKAEQDQIFEFWKTDPVIIKRNDFIFKAYNEFTDEPTVGHLLKILPMDIVLEGINFYSAFAFFYNLARNHKMVATSTMINYINRDEQLHVDVFCKIFQEVLQEFPEHNTPETEEMVRDTLRRGAMLEIEWGKHIIGNKMEGITEDELVDYIKFTANKRLVQLGYQGERLFPEVIHNPMKWIVAYKEADHGKTDFFEQHSRSYKQASEENGFDEL